ncbi:Cys-tRNA(Pro) deacylase [Propionicicella superfundia]|uniref:Cys-tRNA(Pro) deacylase n=1 Tax=Propionicicella superfundia TaxID=348582 RepID=UPI0003FAD21C|nr:Cys-tRNA(Pro) deacylase [Propionicicella superfundia]
MARKSSGGTPATAVLAAAGVPFTLHAYTHRDETRAFGDEAAAELGVDPARIFKTLVCETGQSRPELAVAIVPVAGHLDLKAMATARGAKKASLADPRVAARSSGYVVGGISPLGQRTVLPTVIDVSARQFETILVSAGKRGLQVELAPADLARLTAATFAAVATG